MVQRKEHEMDAMTDAMRLDIYLNYRGTCEEAFRFYEHDLRFERIFRIHRVDARLQPGAGRPSMLFAFFSCR